MSKRHQSSRRKTYGRRQHEVRERQDRGQHAEGFEFELGEWGPAGAGRPARVPRSAQPAHPLRARRLSDGRLRGRPPAHDRAPAPPPGRRCARRSAASGPRGVPRRSADQPPRHRPRRDRRRVHARLLLARAAGPRVGHRARHRPARTRAVAPRGHRGRPPFGPQPPRSRAGHPQAGHRRRPRPAVRTDRHPAATRRSTDRCWAAPIRAADSSSCCCVFVVGVGRARSPGSATGRSSTASAWRRRRWPRRRSRSTRRASAATSTTGPARSSWPRPSSANGWSRRRTS